MSGAIPIKSDDTIVSVDRGLVPNNPNALPNTAYTTHQSDDTPVSDDEWVFIQNYPNAIPVVAGSLLVGSGTAVVGGFPITGAIAAALGVFGACYYYHTKVKVKLGSEEGVKLISNSEGASQ